MELVAVLVFSTRNISSTPVQDVEETDMLVQSLDIRVLLGANHLQDSTVGARCQLLMTIANSAEKEVTGIWKLRLVLNISPKKRLKTAMSTLVSLQDYVESANPKIRYL